MMVTMKNKPHKNNTCFSGPLRLKVIHSLDMLVWWQLLKEFKTVTTFHCLYKPYKIMRHVLKIFYRDELSHTFANTHTYTHHLISHLSCSLDRDFQPRKKIR